MAPRRRPTKRAQTNTSAPLRTRKRGRPAIVDLSTLSLAELKSLGLELVKSAEYTIEKGPDREYDEDLTWNPRSKVFNEAQTEQQKTTLELYKKEHQKHGNLAKSTIKRMKRTIVEWKELEELSKFESSVQESISQDPVLRRNYERKFNSKLDKGLMEYFPVRLGNRFAKIKKLNELQARLSRGKVGKRRGKDRKNIAQVAAPTPITDLSQPIVDLIQQEKYDCPENRTLLTRRGGMMGNNEIPVFCDLSAEVRNQTGFHSELIFETLERTYLDVKKYPDLASFTEKAEKKDYVITCKCCSQGSIVPCWQNPDCDCYKTNIELKKLQARSVDGHPSKAQFHSFKPTIFGGNTDFESTVGFACSELCGCKGHCTNNATIIPEKNIFPTEVFRKDPIVGFGARSMAAIPAGTMVVEFTGELVEGTLMTEVDQDYAFTLSLNSPANIQILTGVGNWSQRFRDELKSQLLCNWHIDSKRKGNLARFCSHSCFPNCAFVRVFQKGFSPAHCRVFLVTLMDVFPGVELTIDYGAKYVEETFTGGCLCKSFACKNNPEVFNKFSSLSEEAMKSYFALCHLSEYNRYRKLLDSAE